MNEQTNQYKANATPVAIEGLHSLCNDVQIAGRWDKIQLKQKQSTTWQLTVVILTWGFATYIYSQKDHWATSSHDQILPDLLSPCYTLISQGTFSWKTALFSLIGVDTLTVGNSTGASLRNEMGMLFEC